MSPFSFMPFGPAPFSCSRRQRIAGLVVLAGVGAGFVALAGRVCYVSRAMGPELIARASKQQRGQRIIPARRGLIFDTRGRVAAGSKQVYSVYADPALVAAATDEAGKSFSELARSVASILHMDAGFLENKIRTSSSPRFCWVKRRVPDAEANAIRSSRLPGIGLRLEMRRTYPFGTRMAHVLGVVGIDGDGLEGLEKAHDHHLCGRPGIYNTIHDARRRAIAGRREGSVEPQDGGHLVLTIDTVIQGFVEEQLAKQIEEFEAESGVAVVMAPGTGEILAMACWPTFDANNYGAFPVAARRNRVVTDPVEPGSTFKPIIAAGALRHGVVTRDETIDCHSGTYQVGQRVLEDTHPRGPSTLAQIVVYSSNIGMGMLGQRLGNTRLYDIVRGFGLGEKSNVKFPGEDAGLVMPLSKWTSYSATSIPMGYEIAVTPLQLATAYCAVLNEGMLLRPRLVRALLGADGKVVESFETPIAVRRVLPADIARYMAQEVLATVVREGTGRRAALYDYEVLGKTGTAKLPYVDRPGYDPRGYLSSFVGAAPADDPEVMALVMIHRPNPDLGYYGSQVAAPAVREILFSTLAYLGVPGRGTIQAGL